jgi:dephospho-CoA kinase
MIIIGLTGGIGSGKSTAAALLEQKGARIIDADRVGHEIYKGGSEGWREVVEAFGPEVVGPDGEIDRRKLGQIVFNSPESLKRLNAITLPHMRAELSRKLEELRQAGTEVAVIDGTRLGAEGWHDLVDEVWLVTAPNEIARERVSVARNRSPEEVEAVLKSQLSNEERKKYAHEVIDNSGTLSDLEDRMEELWERLRPAASFSNRKT